MRQFYTNKSICAFIVHRIPSPFWLILIAYFVFSNLARTVHGKNSCIFFIFPRLTPTEPLFSRGMRRSIGQIRKHDPQQTKTSIHRKIADGLEKGKIKTMTDWSDTIHAKLTALPIQTILTTNYDYAIERSIASDFQPKRITNETTYSLRRYQNVGSKHIFHIHGECRYPQSICLGYEHYAGTLQYIRQQILQSTVSLGKYRSFRLADILYGITEKLKESWVFDFFTDECLGARSLVASYIPHQTTNWWTPTYP